MAFGALIHWMLLHMSASGSYTSIRFLSDVWVLLKPPKTNTLPLTTSPQARALSSRVEAILLQEFLPGSNLSTASKTLVFDRPPIAYKKFLSATAHRHILAILKGATSCHRFVSGLYLRTVLVTSCSSPSPCDPPIMYKNPWKLTTAAKSFEIAPAKDLTGAQQLTDGSYLSATWPSPTTTSVLYNLPRQALMADRMTWFLHGCSRVSVISANLYHFFSDGR